MNPFIIVRRYALFSLALLCASRAFAAYPDRALHLVVPFPAGGAADLVARLIAKPLSTSLGQAVIIENKPGADGIAAAQSVANATPDGYILFMATYGALSAAPALHKTLPYDPQRDFTAIAGAGHFSYFLFAHPDVPASNLAQLQAYIHAHPGQLNFGTGNPGALVMTTEWAQAQHLELTHIPYKGEVPAMNDFLAGRFELMVATPSNTLPWVQKGKLKALVALQDHRSALLPQVPDMVESGMKALTMDTWAGLLGPAGLPVPIRDRLYTELQRILSDPALQAEFARQGFESQASSPAQFEGLIAQQLGAWRTAIMAAGLEPQ